MSLIPVRLGLQQRVLPYYRGPFFDLLAQACLNGLSIFAGKARQEEAVEPLPKLEFAQIQEGSNIHLLSGAMYLCWQKGLIHWIQGWQPDVLIVEANPRYLHTPDAVRWMHHHGRKVIGWGLGVPSFGGKFSSLRSLLRRYFLSQFDALITYSDKGAQQYAQVGFPARRIFVAPNAAVSRPGPLPMRRLGGFNNGVATVLFVGRLQERKRIDLLLSACAALPIEKQPLLWIVGDGPARELLQELAARTYPRTEFFGARHGSELETFYAQSDLFVLPGTGGLAVQQAMAHALPVIVAEADGTQLDLVRPENGWLTSPGSLPSLIETLSVALQDAERLRAMGEQSYNIVANEVNLEKMVLIFMDAVQAVLED